MKRFPQLMAFALGGVLAITVMQSLSGCSDSATLSRLVNHPTMALTSIDRSGAREMDRFFSVYDVYTNAPVNTRSRDHFRDAYRHVRANYVRPVADAKLIDAAIKGVNEMQPKANAENPEKLVEAALDSMLSSLDPHSEYLSPDELKERRVFASGKFGGLGIQVTMEDGLVKVIAPIEDTPADRAGLKAGDLISHLDGKKIEGMELSDAVKVMRGRVGARILLSIIRKGVEPFDVSIKRAIIQVASVRWRLEKDIGYIRITSFTEQTEPGLLRAFGELNKEAGANLKGYVLDLRNNPGGLLDQAIIVSDFFLDQGEIVSIRPRNTDYSHAYDAERGDVAQGLPVVVLINEGSASASEIVAGALKDNSRAKIMGRRSFGKGSVQTIQQLPVEGALQLTTALYHFPSGRSIQARGVVPDIQLDLPEVIHEPDSATAKVDEGGAGDDGAAQSPDEEAQRTFTREVDLPGAISALGKGQRDSETRLNLDTCPEAGIEGKDLELGCAIAYIHAGSAKNFLAAVGAAIHAAGPEM